MLVRRILFVSACVATAACAVILDLEPPPAPDGGDIGSDSGQPDVVAPTCAPLDAALPTDDAGTTFYAFPQNVIDDAGTHAWTFFDTSSVSAAATHFAGGTFDGRYVYFTPSAGGLITRVDTTKAFINAASWATFDPTTLGLPKTGFSGASFDGRYVYFVPLRLANDAGAAGTVVRYDTQLAFATASSWTSFDTALVSTSDGGVAARGFAGSVFDGRFVYLVPSQDGVGPDGRVARYDTAADAGDAGDASTFKTPSSWSTFDTSTALGSASALGFVGGVFDGKNIELAPWFSGTDTGNGGYNAFVTHYDIAKPFATGSSWGSFALDGINGDALGFQGAAFDGQYIYFVPHAHTTVARYDTHKSLTPPSWDMFDLAPFYSQFDGGQASFAGAAFDGRFVYFVPNVVGLGTIARYDTLSTFTSRCAWSTVDVSRYDANAVDFFGAIYDGRYLYFVPQDSTVARFDTKSPGWMPALPAFSGSFY